MNKKRTQLMNEWMCLRFHEKKSCVHIAKIYGTTRQCINKATIDYGMKIYKREVFKKCSRCGKHFIFKKIKDIKTNKYDNKRNYSISEIKFITKNINKIPLQEIANELNRNIRAVRIKISRLGIG
ncbi:MAG: hypothetical protein CMI58_06240 [Parcubacteria group bacterium]|nr:hypothetical protein [Parcubacteria group bacterium]|tara:strand:+ start:5219 stop:5593 length:375 start_codon:yes stop_codon:yes gene_type:complete